MSWQYEAPLFVRATVNKAPATLQILPPGPGPELSFFPAFNDIGLLLSLQSSARAHSWGRGKKTRHLQTTHLNLGVRSKYACPAITIDLQVDVAFSYACIHRRLHLQCVQMYRKQWFVFPPSARTVSAELFALRRRPSKYLYSYAVFTRIFSQYVIHFLCWIAQPNTVIQ